jgi:phage terminase Nu1 subunit (DNA packaging protein)
LPISVAPAFYTMAEVETILNLTYQTVRRLIRAGILVASGRGKGMLVAARSMDALIAWMEQGGNRRGAARDEPHE